MKHSMNEYSFQKNKKMSKQKMTNSCQENNMRTKTSRSKVRATKVFKLLPTQTSPNTPTTTKKRLHTPHINTHSPLTSSSKGLFSSRSSSSGVPSTNAASTATSASPGFMRCIGVELCI